MTINTKLSLKRCWDMVNRIQLAEATADIRKRCDIAEEWVRANEIITNDEFDELMMAISYLRRESYHIDQGFCY